MLRNKYKILIWMLTFVGVQTVYPQEDKSMELDAGLEKFLTDRKGTWRDWNVPSSDGQTLHDLIINNHFTRALEIGTSTGHSAIWISRALNRTGGRLITIEINKSRYEEAVENFKQAGVDHLIDARLADAHRLVYDLEGPFDFIFSDADKDWYKKYMEALLPKLAPGGCFVAHNVRRTRNQRGIAEMLEFARGRQDLETTIDVKGAGMSISCKK